MDIEIHQSNLKTYLCCPRQFEIIYIEQRPVPVSGAALLGIAVHAGIAAGMRDSMRIDTMISAFLDALHRGPDDDHGTKWSGDIVWEDGDSRERAEDDGITILGQILNHIPRQPLAVEQELHKVIDGMPCGGRIDAFDAELGIVDFKTSRRPWHIEKAQRSLQPTFYMMLAGQLFPFRYVICTRGGSVQIIDTERTEADIDTLLDGIVRPVWYNINRGRFPMADPESPLCNPKWCMAWNHCKER